MRVLMCKLYTLIKYAILVCRSLREPIALDEATGLQQKAQARAEIEGVGTTGNARYSGRT